MRFVCSVIIALVWIIHLTIICYLESDRKYWTRDTVSLIYFTIDEIPYILVPILLSFIDIMHGVVIRIVKYIDKIK
jgi:hypothetical protein